MKHSGILNAFVDDTKELLNSIYKEKTNNKTCYLNVGNLFIIDHVPYVLTCLHCVKNTYNITFLINKKPYKCQLFKTSDELELALLSINISKEEIASYEENVYTLYDLHHDLSDVSSLSNNTYIHTVNLNKYLKSNEFEFNDLNASVTEILLEKNNITSLNLPSIPLLSVRLSDDFSDISDLKGISGSLLINDKKVIGMVSSIINSLVNIIPSYVIARFLNEIQLTGKFDGICTLVGNYTLCDFDDPTSRSHIFGMFIENTFDINYNNHYYYENRASLMNLRKNDIIICVNDIILNEKGQIFDKVIGIAIDFRSYIALNYECGSSIPLTIMRPSNNNPDDYKKKKIFVKARPLNSMKYIPITFNNKTYNYHGLIFGEISEDIINNYSNNGIFIVTSFSDFYLNTPYRNQNEYVVVLLDIDKSVIHNNILMKMNDIGLPLINKKDRTYIMPIISKINKKKITSLEDLRSILDKEEEVKINLNINNNESQINIICNKFSIIKIIN